MKVSKKYALELYRLKKKGEIPNTDLLNRLLDKEILDLPYLIAAFRKKVIREKMHGIYKGMQYSES